MKITYLLRDDGACGYYRLSLPLDTWGSKNGTEIYRVQKGDNAKTSVRLIQDSDIVVIPRLGHEEDDFFERVMEINKFGGKKLVVDHDDNMFSVSPFNPAYEDCGTQNVVTKFGVDEYVPTWVDGRNIDIERNVKRQEKLKDAMRVADMVTVTTEYLASVYRPYNKNIKALPNCIDMKLWQKIPIRQRDDIRLYWSGGSSHCEDWQIIEDVLPVIMEKYSNVKLVILGQKFEGSLLKLPQDRIETHDWVPTVAYPYKTAILDPDICIIPLHDNIFNRCKSPIKWVEMGALEVPCVASYVSPYKEIATEQNGVFIEGNGTQDWIDGISLLIEDRILRAKMAGHAYRYVVDNFDINKRWVDWDNAYKELL